MPALTPDVEQRCRAGVRYAVTPAAIARALGWPPARIRRASYRGELEAVLVAGERWTVELDEAERFIGEVVDRTA
jgi:hypothetical protein